MKPFFARFLENQHIDADQVKGGLDLKPVTMKAPSDTDEICTLKELDRD